VIVVAPRNVAVDDASGVVSNPIALPDSGLLLILVMCFVIYDVY